jgi:YVTN family beta-propeller protein
VRKTILCSAIGASLAMIPGGVNSQPPAKGGSLTVTKVPLPGEGRGDYLNVDSAANRLFVTHTTVVHVLDLKTLKPVGEVTGLTYAHGVTSDNRGQAYVTDGNTNSVVIFDPASGRELKRIKVGDKPDSILFDPASGKVLAFNADSNSVSVIDPVTQSAVGTIQLPHPPENAQTDARGHIYVNFEEGNAVGVINTATMTLGHLIPLKGCDGPAPLAIDKAHRRLFSGCGNKLMVVTDPDTGKVLASVKIGGDPDGIIYDPGTRRIFVGNRDGGWTIVRQSGPNNYSVEQTLKIDEYAKTLALDPKTHRVFSSSADLVWPPAVPGKKHLPNAKSGTFRLIVVSQL